MNRGVNSTSTISLHAAQLADGVALGATILFAAETAEAPEWVHLLPAGGAISTNDGRGPYSVPDYVALAAQSLDAGDRVVLDENHSTDLAAPEGRPAPAMGWIVELQARDDGMWGRVEWTDDGRDLVASKKYRAISPVLKIDKQNRVVAFLRASLVNRPNIRGLETLHQENTVNLLARLLKTLGLADTTSEDTLVTAVTTLHQASQAHTTSLNAIATAAGMKAGDTITGDTIVGAIGKLKTAAPANADTITALQSELTTVTNELNTLKTDGAKQKATTFVDGAIAEGRVGVKPLRDHYITRHMANPADVEKEIAALPKLVGSSVVPAGEPQGGTSTSLNAEESEVAKQLGIKPEDFVKAREGQANTSTAAA